MYVNFMLIYLSSLYLPIHYPSNTHLPIHPYFYPLIHLSTIYSSIYPCFCFVSISERVSLSSLGGIELGI